MTPQSRLRLWVASLPAKTWLIGASLLALALIAAASAGIGGSLLIAGVAALVTGIVAFGKRWRTWAQLPPSRPIAAGVIGAGIVLMLVGSSIYGVAHPLPYSVAVPATSQGALGTPPATPIPISDAEPDAPDVVATGPAASVVVTDDNASTLTASALLATLAVKGRAPKTGYDRSAQFGAAWLDVDRNGCDTRNDILVRDLTEVITSGPCKVLGGSLADPYTGTTIAFVRGNDTSLAVQIDHVVSLLDAWQSGAQQLSYEQRVSLANDPLNLLAVDGPSNAQKSASNAASWLPANKEFRCDYVARQISVKAAYGLWVTQAEKDALAHILGECPGQLAIASSFAPAAATMPVPVVPGGESLVETAPAPEPVAPTSYENCDAVRAAGAAPIYAGDQGYAGHLDRDGDGVGCE